MVPVHFVRYEDLVLRPKETYQDMMKFMLNLDSIDGTNADHRIDSVLAMGAKATQTYRLKNQGLNSNAFRYSPAQLEFIKTELSRHLYFFGYTNFEQSETTFFEYASHEHENATLHNGFKRANAAATKDTQETQEMATAVPKQYVHNAGERMVDLLPEPFMAKLNGPICEHARKVLQGAVHQP